ncbi:hypothetical protein MLD38_017637 [Melastoma candidum]|uniref:Uncharacterized protein n=1 Tax=Melastoma candidum TaxID=119954 RepID=A0ACB9QUS2_9MYRT|nr:hypothetical protein MLD38_017637 [Melastoma candidum]
MEESESNHGGRRRCHKCGSFGKKCGHLVKKQRTKFYILRRCIAMLLCWRDESNAASSNSFTRALYAMICNILFMYLDGSARISPSL